MPGSIASPLSSGRIVITPLFIAISWTSTLPAISADAADQPVRRRALVLDGEIAAGDLRAARRGPAPGLRDDEIAGLDLLGARGRRDTAARERREGEDA